MEPSICSTSVTPAAADKCRFLAPKILPGVQHLSTTDVYGPGIAALIPLRGGGNQTYDSHATSGAELALRARTRNSHSDASYWQLPDVHALSPPWSHLVLPPNIRGFMATIAMMTGITGRMSFLALADAAMCFLLRRTALPADKNITAIPPAIRIIEAQPDSQDEESLWHAPALSFAAHKINNNNNKDNSLSGDRNEEGVPQISFWLLLKHLPTPLRRRILCTTGTLHSSAAAPYLSAQICSNQRCGHVKPEACEAFRTLASVGTTNLFNRFLLREKASYVQGRMHMDTSNVAHYAIVIG